MSVEITSKQEQKLLKRTILTAKVGFEGATPDRIHLRKQVAKAAGAKDDHVIIRTIKTGFGGGHALIEAAVYENVEDAKTLEKKNLVEKHEPKKAKEES
jgi:ribosomal protein S24E